MPVVPGILQPPGVASTDAPESGQPATQPVRDGIFAKELTKRVGREPQLLEPTRTHLSGGEAARALGAAWRQRFGEAAPSGALEVLVADWAHETGHGQAMMNYNFGGIKGTGPSGLSAAYLTTEGAGATEHKIVDRFRAYRSATEGAADYVALLADRFPKALDAARRGDAAEFVRALKQGGYFTGSEDVYTNSVVSLAERARAQGFNALGTPKVQADGTATTAPSRVASAAPASPTSLGTLNDVSAIDAIRLALDAAHRSSSGPGDVRSRAALAHADALAMSDELSRAALRIAASGPEKRDDDV